MNEIAKANNIAENLNNYYGEQYGARKDDLGLLGGGSGYKKYILEGDYTVTSIVELLNALDNVQSGETIFIPSDVIIDMTALAYIDKFDLLKIPTGVTLASDRGFNDSFGGMIYTSAPAHVLIKTLGENVRFTGLRIIGGDKYELRDHWERAYGDGNNDINYYFSYMRSEGIWNSYNGLEVDNCEISGFGFAAIYIAGGSNIKIHHCYLHDNPRLGLGYGVNIEGNSHPEIYSNVFDFNRHDIAGNGTSGCGYTARNNIVMNRDLEKYSHRFDMHGDSTGSAGTLINIEHNTFVSPIRSINIRGNPREMCNVQNNIFHTHKKDDQNYAIVCSGENIKISKNVWRYDVINYDGMMESIIGI